VIEANGFSVAGYTITSTSVATYENDDTNGGSDAVAADEAGNNDVNSATRGVVSFAAVAAVAAAALLL
jgi:hypothetical protein